MYPRAKVVARGIYVLSVYKREHAFRTSLLSILHPRETFIV
jgi:hypothetical protein